MNILFYLLLLLLHILYSFSCFLCYPSIGMQKKKKKWMGGRACALNFDWLNSVCCLLIHAPSSPFLLLWSFPSAKPAQLGLAWPGHVVVYFNSYEESILQKTTGISFLFLFVFHIILKISRSSSNEDNMCNNRKRGSWSNWLLSMFLWHFPRYVTGHSSMPVVADLHRN